MKKKVIIIIALAVSIGLIVMIILTIRAYFLPKGISIDKEQYPITGIDVSRHSGVIDWKKIKRQHIDFVYIKATEGETYLDPNYLVNITAAHKVNLNVGEYHFFRFNKPGKTQAVNFLAHIKNIPGKLNPMVDVEEWGNMPVVKTEKEIRKEITAFLLEIEKVTEDKMIIYTNINSYNRFIKGHFEDNPIWICSFNKDRIIPDNRNWLFWQHAHNGKLDGIKGYVDLNTFNGSAEEWKMYLNSGTMP
ncbi:MAG: GH25 family lysozyme [Paludibacter sp.]|nr:GH25 family lysozyme [Paludibacter sp.]